MQAARHDDDDDDYLKLLPTAAADTVPSSFGRDGSGMIVIIKKNEINKLSSNSRKSYFHSLYSDAMLLRNSWIHIILLCR